MVTQVVVVVEVVVAVAVVVAVTVVVAVAEAVAVVKSLVYCPFCSRKTELWDTLQAVIYMYILIRCIY